MSEPRRPWLPYLALAAIALIWGASFLFIKVAVQDMSPMVLVLIRSSAGCLALAVLMIATRRQLFPNARRDLIGAVAVLLASVSYALSALYQRRKLRGVNVFEANLGQLAFTALFVLPVAVPSLPAAHFEPRSIAAVLALGNVGRRARIDPSLKRPRRD